MLTHHLFPKSMERQLQYRIHLSSLSGTGPCTIGEPRTEPACAVLSSVFSCCLNLSGPAGLPPADFRFADRKKSAARGCLLALESREHPLPAANCRWRPRKRSPEQPDSARACPRHCEFQCLPCYRIQLRGPHSCFSPAARLPLHL